MSCHAEGSVNKDRECCTGNECRCCLYESLEIHTYLKNLFSDLSDSDVDKIYASLVTEARFLSFSQLSKSKVTTIYNATPNIPLAYIDRLISDLERREDVVDVTITPRLLLFYVSSITYIGFCFSLIAFNSLLVKGNVTDSQIRVFHVVEFTIPLCYALVLLVTIPKLSFYALPVSSSTLTGRHKNYIWDYVKIGSLSFQTITSTIAALLIYFSQEDFEDIAHYLEYSSFLLWSTVDLIVILTSEKGGWRQSLSFVLTIVSILGVIGMICMMCYKMEFKVHYLELSIEIVLVVGTILTVEEI